MSELINTNSDEELLMTVWTLMMDGLRKPALH